MKIVSLITIVGVVVLVSGCIDEPRPKRDGAKMHRLKENPYPTASIADKMKNPHPGVVYLDETDLGKVKKPKKPLPPNMIDVNKLNGPQ